MSPSARRMLERACEQEGLDPAGWEHYSTGITDDGASAFGYDREDGALLRVIVVPAAGLRIKLVVGYTPPAPTSPIPNGEPGRDYTDDEWRAIGEHHREWRERATPTCRCGQWPVEEYGDVCPSCVADIGLTSREAF
jgi:hypothetical protein